MRILLGITGSVATTLTQKLVRELSSRGHEVELVFTNSSIQFVNPTNIIGGGGYIPCHGDEDEY